MKKIGIISLMILVIFELSGCSLGLSEFEKALDNMEDTNSVTMDLTIENVPLVGTALFYIKIDEDKVETSGLTITNYAFIEDETPYEIRTFNNEYIAIEIIEETDNMFDISMFDDFTSDDFILNDEGYYTTEKEFDEISNIQIKIENDLLVQAIYNMSIDGYTIDVTADFSDYNETVVELPEFRYLSSFESILFRLDNLGYIYTDTDSGFTLSAWITDIDFSDGDEIYTITTWYDEVTFNPITEMIVPDSTVPVHYIEYCNGDNPIDIDKEVYDLFIELFNAIDE